MAAERIFDEVDVQELLEQNAAPPFGARNAAFPPKGMFDNGAGWSDLMKVTGINQKRTLEKKVRPHERELEAVLASLFSRVKMP